MLWLYFIFFFANAFDLRGKGRVDRQSTLQVEQGATCSPLTPCAYYDTVSGICSNSCTISCLLGGTMSFECSSTGSWSTSSAPCPYVQCPETIDANGAAGSCTQGRFLTSACEVPCKSNSNTKLRFTCDGVFGVDTVGTWKVLNGSCPVNCAASSIAPNYGTAGNCGSGPIAQGSSCSVTCNNGVASGSTTRTCNNGVLSALPTCQSGPAYHPSLYITTYEEWGQSWIFHLRVVVIGGSSDPSNYCQGDIEVTISPSSDKIRGAKRTIQLYPIFDVTRGGSTMYWYFKLGDMVEHTTYTFSVNYFGSSQCASASGTSTYYRRHLPIDP